MDSDLELGEAELGYVAAGKISVGNVLLEIPGHLAVTAADVDKDEILSTIAGERSEIVGLALFLMQERRKETASTWAPLLAALPARIDTPVLWEDAHRNELLRGSPVLEESRSRKAALNAEWSDIVEKHPAVIKELNFNRDGFLEAMSVVLSSAIYLPSAQCFALLPIASSMRRTGSAGGATIDYEPETGSVIVRATRPYEAGQEVRLFDGRPSGEVFLATGSIEPANPADCLVLSAGLVAADRLYSQKAAILEEFGFKNREEFPIFADRIATQHLAYLRFSRLTDAAQFPAVSFETDNIISPENEYEILQLLMGDLRERLQGYASQYEDDIKELQRKDISRRERAAAALRAAEKRVLRGTMDGVRRRLAPIRGIPTKDGSLTDPNADLNEVFEVLESLPSAPKKLFQGLAAWARGENDPEWKKGKKSRNNMR